MLAAATRAARASLAVSHTRHLLAASPQGGRFRGFATKVTAAMVKELRQMTNAPMMECKAALSNAEVGGDMDKAVEWLRKNGVATAEKKSGRETAAGVVGALVRPDAGTAAVVELNSETDFVAKNEHFVAAVNTILGATVSADLAALGNNAAAGPAGQHDVDPEKLLELAVDGDDGNVRGLVTRVVATVRENIAVRRAARLSFDPASEVVGTYVHNSGGTNCGSSVAAVQVRSSGSTEGLEDLAKKLAMHVVAAKPRFLGPDDVPAELVEKERSILRDEVLQSGKPADKVEMIVNGRLNKFFGEVSLLKQPFVMEDKKSIEKVLKDAGKAAGVTLEIPAFVRYECGEP